MLLNSFVDDPLTKEKKTLFTNLNEIAESFFSIGLSGKRPALQTIDD